MDFSKLASGVSVVRAGEAVKNRGIRVELLENRETALARLKDMIPSGAEVMCGSSKTLEQIGFVDLLASGSHPWKNVRGAILKEKDPAKQAVLRRQSILSDYYLGSVHAIAETGEIVVASASGSQLPAYVYSSKHVIWVAGTQKIVPSLELALRRVREYVFPLEDDRMKSAGYPGSTLAKILIFERETAMMGREITLLLVADKLGF